MKKTTTPRLAEVDIVKGVAILSVVLLHIDYAWPDSPWLPLSGLLGGLWRVPVFFLVAGFFLSDRQLLQPATFIKAKLRRLYLPLLGLYVPAVVVHNCLLDIGWYDTVTDYGGKLMAYRTTGETLRAVAEAICFAGREPILGAMWFVYVLTLALAGLSLTSWLAARLTRRQGQPATGDLGLGFETVRGLLLFLLCALSCTATRVFGCTIPRLNNTLTAMWLVYVGMLCWRWRHLVGGRAMWLGAAAGLYLLTVWLRSTSLNSNTYTDVITLTVASVAALVVLLLPARGLAPTLGGRCLACVGRHSFAVMALHLAAFKVVQEVMLATGHPTHLAANGVSAHGLVEVVCFLVMGTALPLLLAAAWQTLLKIFNRCYESV